MNKILFLDLNNIYDTKNITLKNHYLIRDKPVFNFRKNKLGKISQNTGVYSNIIQDNKNKNKLQLAYRLVATGDIQMTGMATSNNFGELFKSIPEVRENFASHNFSLFYDDKNILCGIGGVHNSIPYNKNPKYEKLVVPSHVWNKKIILHDSEVHCAEKKNGLYLYNFIDNKWQLKHKLPIFDSFRYSEFVKFGIIAFDTLPKVLSLQDGNFIVYFRANVDLDVRMIIYSKTKNFKDWEPLKYINIENYDYDIKGDNMYFPGIFKYPNSNIFIGLIPFFKTIQPGRITTYGATKLMFSPDGINWKVLRDMFVRTNDTNKSDGQKTRYKYDIAGIILSPNKKELFVFFHENVYRMNNSITKYTIRYDGFTSLYSDNGEFSINIKNSKKYYLNYLVKDGGYLKLDIFENNKLVKSRKYVGDEVSQEMNINSKEKELIFKIVLNKANIFSISYI